MIFTFYSYKGGVGRSMALANVADLLARRGLRVLVIDFDLEAPGLEQFFLTSPSKVRRHRGLLDLLLSYKESMSVGGSVGGEPSFKQLQEHFVVPISDVFSNGGRLDILPAGQRDDEEQLAGYALNLRTFDWQDFFFNWAGEMFFEWLRQSLVPEMYDVVLIDSRTGVTEMGGICAYQLSDAIVMLCAANQQNLDGTHSVVENFFSERVRALRRHRPLQVVVVPARVEQRNAALLEKFQAEFEKRFAKRTPPTLVEEGLWSLMIPYEPRYAFEEQVVTRAGGQSERREVASAFHRLADALLRLAGPETPLAQRLAALEGRDAERGERVAAQYDPTRRFAGYHAVVSYARADRERSERLAQLLDDRGVRVLLDCSDCAVGADARVRMEETVLHSDNFVVVAGAAGLSKGQEEYLRLAGSLPGQSAAVPVRAVLLPGAGDIDGKLPSEAICLQWVEADPLGENLLDRLVPLLLGSEEPAQARVDHGPPYVGLQPFDEQHSALFFGREKMVRRLCDSVQTERFTAIVGPSGCGKSSLVRAGLFPALRRGEVPGSDQWRLLSVRPGTQPLRSLARSLLTLAPHLTQDTILERLENGENGLTDLVMELPAGDATDGDAKRVVLFVDQFEEVSTVCQDAEERRKFIDLLVAAARTQRGPVTIVVGLRGDFFSRLGEDRALANWLQSNLFLLTAPGPRELRLAVEEPARRAGLAFEPGLVDRILADLGTEPGALPLLQFLLLQLWERRHDGWLTNNAYDAIGGVQGALAHHAERVYGDLSPSRQAIAQRILLRLTRRGEGTGDTRRKAALTELLPAEGTDFAVKETIKRLSDARLLTLGDEEGQTSVELAHEALIRGWPRLRQWLDENHSFLLWHQRFQVALEQWALTGRDTSTVLRGAPLAEAADWLSRRRDDLSAQERDFVDRSVAHQKWVDTRRRRRVRQMTVVTAVAVISTIGALWSLSVVYAQRELAESTSDVLKEEMFRARTARDSAKISQLIADLQRGDAERNKERADSAVAELSLAMAGLETEKRNVQRERDAARRADSLTQEALRISRAAEDELLATVAERDSALARFASALASAKTALDAELAAKWEAGLANRAAATTLSPDGRRLVTMSRAGPALLVDAVSNTPIEILGKQPDDNVTAAAFSPNSAILATANEDGTVRLWRSSDGDKIETLDGHTGKVRKMVFSPDGQRLATASDDGTARIWNVRRDDEEHILRGEGRALVDVGFGAGGRIVATDIAGRLIAWDLRTGDREREATP